MPFKNPTPQGQDEGTQRAFDAVAAYINTTFFRQVCDGAALSYTFPVPQTYTHIGFRFTGIVAGATSRAMSLVLNSDTGANYYRDQMYRQYGDVGAGTGFSGNENAAVIGDIGDDSNRMTLIEGIFPLYMSSIGKRSWSFKQTQLGNATSANDNMIIGCGSWESTAAISTIKVQIATTAWSAGSLIEFYGIW